MSLLPSGVRRRLRSRPVHQEDGVADDASGEPGPDDRERLTDDFHRLYYETGEAGGTWKNTTFLGVPTWKSPLDLWVYQELLWELRPGLIVETGTAHGGSALYLATLCQIIGGGEVVSIDIGEWPDRPAHPRLTYVVASSTDPQVVAQVAERARTAGTVLVVLDSDHSRDHVLAELRAYAPLVTRGSYLVVEDTNVNGHPVYEAFGPGPMEAVQDFLKERDDFEVDRSREKFLLTFNPGGWLRKR
ncbi:MAG TPA: CmcI family methyltransferase [Actinomycetota bacterium]|jgi:cephalosporin hydroxylase|nr:CmcI family methyltransferase [Actinomycetota bacterium]